MNIPENLKYTKEHEWVKIEGDLAIVGITEHAQAQLGDIVFVDIQTVGETMDKDEVFGAIEAVKTVADAFMPLSGTVEEVNEALEGDPQLVNKDPYGEGWMVKIKMTAPEEVETLLDAAAYGKLIS
ncbi:MAG: glycine cleavage system protein GcvH [Bacteroidales bacterium]|jgi:glycine cleavage system H protein|nr:glycine cleavage system protein GcvH [Bacteroidales bacterium]MDD2771605.1 glycine cleavage system protein GcvH [Bacteroidales bacterium]MDD3105624.1 glycine cleavage system protein GcvH [Bacteroidales bacterium]MDD3548868.1 glycine cleavage system protein GcvH [Bacteroidales bacterium]MDD4065077.1 glycine cleavage system protein GcvH [Bacteroidales bacterium]